MTSEFPLASHRLLGRPAARAALSVSSSFLRAQSNMHCAKSRVSGGRSCAEEGVWVAMCAARTSTRAQDGRWKSSSCLSWPSSPPRPARVSACFPLFLRTEHSPRPSGQAVAIHVPEFFGPRRFFLVLLSLSQCPAQHWRGWKARRELDHDRKCVSLHWTDTRR
jgi:hypothetical protein